MRKALLLILALAVATPALAYEVYYYNGLPCKHTSGQMPWTEHFNNRGTPDCTNEWSQEELALASWTNVSGQWFQNLRGSDSTVLNYGNDGVVLVVFYEPDYATYGQTSWPWASNAIAVNVFWLQNSGSYYTVTHNDMCNNGYNFPWSDSGAPSAMDVQNIGAHESGHNLILNDLYTAAASEYTMYGYSSYGETKKRSLEADDIAGIRFLYPNLGIAVEKFTATAREGAVELAWRLATEESVAGYNLYRRVNDGRDNDYTKVNGALITGRAPYTYRDEAVAAGTAYQYLLEVVELTGTKEQFGPVGVELRGGGKYAFGLAQSYPNPARERATIKYTLATAGEATLAVYDLTGRRVTTLASGNRPAGEHEVVWPLVGTDGARVPAGVYIYRLEAAGDAATRRLVVTH